MPQNTTNNNEPVIPNVNTDNQTANPNNNTTAVPDANAPEASVASNTNAVQQTAASMPTANNSAATLETETTNDAADNHQDTEQQPTFSTEDIVKVSEEIKATIENGIPVDEDGKESLNEKFNDLAEAMETFGHDLKTEKGTDKYEESKDYANEISNLITDITNNDGSQNEKIKEGILNLLDKTIPQTVDDVKAVEIEALSNNDIKNDTDKVDNTTGNNRVDISQFDQLGEEFQNAFKETKADNKQQVYDKLVNLFHKNFGYNQNSTMIAHSLCKNYEEDKLGKINGARSKIGDEKNNLLGITKGHRFESKVEVGKFERSLDRIEREIDNIGNNLKSDASIKICQGLKVEFSAMRAHIDQGLEKLNAVGSKSNIKGFQSDVFKTLDAINERIDEIKENEFIVLGSDIDTHLGIDLNVDNPDLKEKDTVDQKETKGIEKTGDAKVDRYNAKLISITGLDKKKAEEKGSNKENSDINGKDKTNSESTSTTNRLEKSPYYTWNLLVRDIYAYSRNVPINGMNVTAGKIVADISNLIQAVGIPAAVIVSIVGGLAVLIDRVVNGPEKGDADKVERTEKVQEFVNEVCKGLEEKGLLNDVEISSDDVETTENQDQVEQEQNPDEEDYVDNNNPDNDEANQEIEESKENSVEQEESDNQEDVEQNQEETEIQNETTDVEESEEDPEHVESEEEESDSPEVTEDDNQDESDNSDPQKGEDTHDESGEDSTDTNVDSTNKQEDQNPDDNKKSQDTSKSENKDTEVEKEQTPESENKVSKDSEDNQKTQETTKTESKDTEVEKEQIPEPENKVSKDSEDNQKTQETTKTENKDTEVEKEQIPEPENKVSKESDDGKKSDKATSEGQEGAVSAEDSKKKEDTAKPEDKSAHVDNDIPDSKDNANKKDVDNKNANDTSKSENQEGQVEKNKSDKNEKTQDVDKNSKKESQPDKDNNADSKDKIDKNSNRKADNQKVDKSDEKSTNADTEKSETNYDQKWKERMQSQFEKYDYKKITLSSVRNEIKECAKAIPDAERRANTLGMAAKDAFAKHAGKWPGKSHDARMKNINQIIKQGPEGNVPSPGSGSGSSILARFNNILQAIIDDGKVKISAIGSFLKSHSSVFANVGVTIVLGVGGVMLAPSDIKAAEVDAGVEKEQVVSAVEMKEETSFDSEKIEVDGLTIDLSDEKTTDSADHTEQGIAAENVENKIDDEKKPDDTKDKVESSKAENKDTEKSDTRETKETSVDNKEDDSKNQVEKSEDEEDTNSDVSQDEKDLDPTDQEEQEEDNADITSDDNEAEIEPEVNDTEAEEDSTVEIEESEEDSIEQEESENQEDIEQNQDETEAQDENADVEESEEDSDHVESEEDEHESVEVTEDENQDEPDNSADEGRVEQKSDDNDESRDDAVAAMDDDADDENKKDKGGAGVVEVDDFDSQDGEDTHNESDEDPTDTEVDPTDKQDDQNPDEEKSDAKEAAIGKDDSDAEGQTEVEVKEDDEENESEGSVENSENTAESNDTIEDLSDAMQDGALDMSNDEAVNKAAEVSMENDETANDTTADNSPADSNSSDAVEGNEKLSFTDSVLNTVELSGGDIDSVVADEILNRDGTVAEYTDEIENLQNQGFDIDVDAVIDYVYLDQTDPADFSTSFVFGDGTSYQLGDVETGITPIDMDAADYDSQMDNIDLDSMIDRTASDFASYSEDLIEAVTSDISLPDVDNPELDVDVSENTDTGLEAHQSDSVDASDNLDNAADNAAKDFDPSDNDQSSNVDIVDPSQNQNNNGTSASDNDNYFDNDSSYKDY